MTVRTQAELLALFAENEDGNIGSVDLRDLVDTVFSLAEALAIGIPTVAEAPNVGAGTDEPLGTMVNVTTEAGARSELWYHGGTAPTDWTRIA